MNSLSRGFTPLLEPSMFVLSERLKRILSTILYGSGESVESKVLKAWEYDVAEDFISCQFRRQPCHLMAVLNWSELSVLQRARNIQTNKSQKNLQLHLCNANLRDILLIKRSHFLYHLIKEKEDFVVKKQEEKKEAIILLCLYYFFHASEYGMHRKFYKHFFKKLFLTFLVNND